MERIGDKETQPVYKGEVENGVPNGLGFLICPSGTKSVGSWKYEKRNGQGIETYLSGQKYEGQWRDGEIDGGVKFFYSGGSKYIKIKFLEIKI